ncbi:MAG: hypothetical protein CVU11_16060 [Bacteroidetes bacterium HGW-Bacteroidetes-6]|jgi:hypothetical protein|nr:MAG: hypothetical protein CVU11_16060 [Bacteroidetes bacterium HGW-Bacteroidetes-6]
MKNLLLALCLIFLTVIGHSQIFKFAVLCDTRSDAANNGITGVNVSAVKAVCSHLIQSGAEFVIAPGDFICGNVTWYNPTKTPPDNKVQYQAFLTACRSVGVGLPGEENMITLYAVRGNHECYQQILPKKSIEEAWLMSIGYSLPKNGPDDELGFTYSFLYKGSLFIGMDQYMHANAAQNDSIVLNQAWLDKVLLKYPEALHVFVFGHTPAFAAQHQDCLGQDSIARNKFMRSISSRSGVYFCGHDHFYARANIPVYATNGEIENRMQQVITPSGAPFLGGFSPKWNGVYKNTDVKTEAYIDNAVGYQLVTIDGKNVTVEFIATNDACTFTIDSTGVYSYRYNDNWQTWNFATMSRFSYELP